MPDATVGTLIAHCQQGPMDGLDTEILGGAWPGLLRVTYPTDANRDARPGDPVAVYALAPLSPAGGHAVYLYLEDQ
jgi:hypothetical protein